MNYNDSADMIIWNDKNDAARNQITQYQQQQKVDTYLKFFFFFFSFAPLLRGGVCVYEKWGV